MDKTLSTKTTIKSNSLNKGNKMIDLKVVIVGQNEVVGLDDLHKDQKSVRTQKVQCSSDQAKMLYLSKNDYEKFFLRSLNDDAIKQSKNLDLPYLKERV